MAAFVDDKSTLDAISRVIWEGREYVKAKWIQCLSIEE
jgi:hypothetical protein